MSYFLKSFCISFLCLVCVLSATLAIPAHAETTEQGSSITQESTAPQEVTPPQESTAPQEVTPPQESTAPQEVTETQELPVNDDVAMIRLYMEFVLFGLLPLGLAIFIICIGCWWFYCVFIRM